MSEDPKVTEFSNHQDLIAYIEAGVQNFALYDV